MRCDFSHVYQILDRYMSRGYGINQIDKVTAMYYSFLVEWDHMDYGQVSRWINGKSALTPDIGEYYTAVGKKEVLRDDIRKHLLPLLIDAEKAANELYNLVTQDDSISTGMRRELIRNYGTDKNDRLELFLSDLLYFAACRPFVREKGAAKKLAGTESLSPDVSERIRGARPPLPVKHFTGRRHELEDLHELFVREKTVFLHGIAGIGKSELSREYAKAHKKDYTNILSLTYNGDLKRDIADMIFTDDFMGEDDKVRFERHDRFLRTLKGDTLLIIDNFDTSEDAEPFLPDILQYECRMLFISRYLWEDYPSLELTEMEEEDDLIAIIEEICPEAALDPVAVEKVISLVHRHTLSVELAARLMARGILSMDELLVRLQEDPSVQDSHDKIRIRKDGKVQKETYRDHIRILFGLFSLDEHKKNCLADMSMMPLKGISAKRFAALSGYTDLNPVNDLIEMGLIHEDAGGLISLHPLIRERVYEDIRPDEGACRELCDNIRQQVLLFGEDISWYRQMDEIITNIMDHMKKKKDGYYLTFLQDVYTHMEKYDNYELKQKVLSEMKRALKKNSLSTGDDEALYYDYLASECSEPLKALSLAKKAARILTADTDNIALKINVHQNLFLRYIVAGKLKEAMEQCGRVERLYRIYPEYRQHDWLIFQMNKGVLLIQQGLYVLARQILEECRECMIAAGMEDSQDYALLAILLASVSQKLYDRETALRYLEKSRHIYIYGTIYRDDQVKAGKYLKPIDEIESYMDEHLTSGNRVFAIDNQTQ